MSRAYLSDCFTTYRGENFTKVYKKTFTYSKFCSFSNQKMSGGRPEAKEWMHYTRVNPSSNNLRARCNGCNQERRALIDSLRAHVQVCTGLREKGIINDTHAHELGNASNDLHRKRSHDIDSDCEEIGTVNKVLKQTFLPMQFHYKSSLH